MEFTPQSNSITGDLIRTAHVSEGALVKVALPEMRVPGYVAHPSHSLECPPGAAGRTGPGEQCLAEQGVGDAEGNTTSCSVSGPLSI